jgi:hypothetical protein
MEQYDFHGFRRSEVVDGLTQDSFITHDSSSFGGGEFDGNPDDDDTMSLESQPFARSLQLPLAPRSRSARDKLKPYLEELFACLDRLNEMSEIERVGKMMENEVGRLRCIIAQSTKKRRREVENVVSVNVVTETRANNPKRILGTRHMQHFKGPKK